jgi:hypothetical protein
MHDFDRLYLVTAWSYILAFHLTMLAFSAETGDFLARMLPEGFFI